MNSFANFFRTATAAARPDSLSLPAAGESGDDLGEEYATADIPADINVQATYPIAVTKDAANADLANAFLAFVLSADGQSILQKHGFGAP